MPRISRVGIPSPLHRVSTPRPGRGTAPRLLPKPRAWRTQPGRYRGGRQTGVQPGPQPPRQRVRREAVACRRTAWTPACGPRGPRESAPPPPVAHGNGLQVDCRPELGPDRLPTWPADSKAPQLCPAETRGAARPSLTCESVRPFQPRQDQRLAAGRRGASVAGRASWPMLPSPSHGRPAPPCAARRAGGRVANSCSMANPAVNPRPTLGRHLTLREGDGVLRASSG